MTVHELAGLLTDDARQGAPEPSLLPWLARRVALTGLPAVAAAGAGILSARPRHWAVIADAVAAIVAERETSPARLARMLTILPPVAAYLTSECRDHIDWAGVSADAAGYAALTAGPHAGRPGLIAWATLAGPYPWAVILAAGDEPWGGAAGRPALPPLAEIRSLWWLAPAGARDRPARTDQEAVYLLPFRSGEHAQWQAFQAVEAAVDAGRPWYAAALIARAAPYLTNRARLQIAIFRLPVPWAAQLAPMAGTSALPWARDEDELAASHPAISRLDEFAAAADSKELARACLAAVRQMAKTHRLTGKWGIGPQPAAPAPARGQSYVLGSAEQVRLSVSERLDSPPPPGSGITGRPIWAQGDQAPAGRFLNVYVARAGREEPVPPAPLGLSTDYVVRCNIGMADYRSLLDQVSARFPDDFLPAGPVDLRIVLFLDGRVAAVEPVVLPAAGSTPWIELPLPHVAEPSVIHGEIGVYYGPSVVLMYTLIMPFGRTAAAAPEAELRYRLSRSLTDLAKLDGRTMSVAIGESGARPAVYVNGLSFAPTGYRYQSSEVSQASFLVRTALYDAHFSGNEDGEVSKYAGSRSSPYSKTAQQLDRDLRELARCGSLAYGYLFRDGDHIRLLHTLRDEAAARWRLPVLQIVSVADQPVPVPWACLYDLPLDNEVADYEPCPSIAEFGPGGLLADPPARCPYEDSHRSGSRWKLNQLCPWGFWGLSAIIEQPPSAKARDLETRVRAAAGPPAMLVGYDTTLDSDLRQHHLSALQDQRGKEIIEPFIIRRTEVREALRTEDMDIIYLYCHVTDDPTFPGHRVPAIGFGDSRITPKDIQAWTDTEWPDPHWPARHPLVIINGCGSVSEGPGSLSNLVDAFVDQAGASGVIGTEITIEQGLAGWAMELFLQALRDHPVGEALRTTRWKMFQRGNLIGLAYTPYCLAGLTLPPQLERA